MQNNECLDSKETAGSRQRDPFLKKHLQNIQNCFSLCDLWTPGVSVKVPIHPEHLEFELADLKDISHLIFFCSSEGVLFGKHPNDKS